jgi:MFS family permease
VCHDAPVGQTEAPTRGVESTSVWRLPGMAALLVMSMSGFCGYAALVSVTPLWAVHGGAGSTGAGAVNGVLMGFTVLTQPFVPRALRRAGWGPVMVLGLLLLGIPSLLHLLTDGLGVTLALSAVRGLGFGILTVTGSAAIAELVPKPQRGVAIGAYGLSIAGPQFALLPLSPWVATEVGFWAVFVAGALPLVGCAPALALGRRLPRDSAAVVGIEPVQRRGHTYRVLLRPMTLLLVVTLAGGALITFLPQIAHAGWVTVAGLLLLTGSSAVSRWAVGGPADRHGSQPFMWPLILLAAVAMAVVAYAVHLGDAGAAGLLLVTAMAVLGVSYGALQNLTLLVSFESVKPHEYGVASAVWNVGFDSGTGLGAVLVGALAAGTSFPVALACTGAVLLLALPLAAWRPRASSAVAAPTSP